MRIEPSGIVMIGECEIQTPVCSALTPAPITAVWGSPGRRQINVCRQCLAEMVRLGEWENPGAKIQRIYDIAVYDQQERLQLVVEVKKHPYELATRMEDWATRIRRNLLLHSGIPSSVYFMLAVLPAPFYLWDQEDTPDALPRYALDVRSEIMPLLSSADDSEAQITGAVSSWLESVIDGIAAKEGFSEGQTGLYQAIQGGRVVREAKADAGEARVLQAA